MDQGTEPGRINVRNFTQINNDGRGILAAHRTLQGILGECCSAFITIGLKIVPAILGSFKRNPYRRKTLHSRTTKPPVLETLRTQ